MRITEVAEAALAGVERLKESKVAEATGPDAFVDVHIVVNGFRGEEQVVTAFPMQLDRDAGLQAVGLIAVGFGCDAVTMTIETYRVHGTENRNPLTGRPWRPGEMQAIAEDGGLERYDWLAEGLVTTAVNRAGDAVLAARDYKVHRTQNALGIWRYRLQWLTERHVVEGDGVHELVGRVPETMAKFMTRLTIDQVLSRTGVSYRDFELSDEAGRAHADCATVKFLHQIGWEGAVLLDAPPGSERAAVIETSLAPYVHRRSP